MAGLGGYMLRVLLQYPDVLSIGPAGVELRGTGPSSTFRPISFLWSNPRLHMQLIDRRGLSFKRPDGLPIPPFGLMSNSQISVDIPQDAFNLILERANERGLEIRPRTVPMAIAGGAYIQYDIRPHRNPK